MINTLRFVGLLFVLVISQNSFAHNYFVSITTLDVRTEKGTVEISIKLTTHDVEKSLEEFGSDNLRLGTQKELEDADLLLSNYFKKHFVLWINKKMVELNFIGKEVEMDENLWLYFEGKIPKKIKSFKIINDILIETFSEQNNILHINYKSLPISFTFTKNQTEKIFQF